MAPVEVAAPPPKMENPFEPGAGAASLDAGEPAYIISYDLSLSLSLYIYIYTYIHII